MAGPYPSLGKVYLVGAGPGDPSLITLRGVECLRRADLVLYDYLVNPLVVAHAAHQAERICLGRHGRQRIMPADEVIRRMIDAARLGKIVVRLKGGDPTIFAHGAEEVAALTAAAIPFEIVPGITAALAAGSYAGIPLTHGGVASALAFVTGQEREGKEELALDFSALASFPGTLVFYMGVTTAREWTGALIGAGKDPETPAAIVRRCSWPDQETILCTLGSVADELERRQMRPPVITVVGAVLAGATAHNWFAERPLFGVRVLVTRPVDQADALAEQLLELGADVILQPAIEISDPPDWQAVDRALDQLDSYDWIVFSSGNGVRYLLNRLINRGHDLRHLGRVHLAAIGSATAEELTRWHLRADLVPEEFRAETLAAALAERAAGQRFLLARASRGREVLAEQLQAADATVDQVVVYRSTDVTQPDPDVAEQLAGGKIDWITVTSSAIAHSLAAMFGRSLDRARLVSISPVTSATLRELGFEPAAEATEYTMNGLVRVLCNRA